MTDPRPPSPWRLPVVLLLAFSLTPLAVMAWILLSGGRRAAYLRSWWVRAGLAIAVVGSLPLLGIGIAAHAGWWPDPNPNPVGFGLLFVASVMLGSLAALVGVLWTHFPAREA